MSPPTPTAPTDKPLCNRGCTDTITTDLIPPSATYHPLAGFRGTTCRTSTNAFPEQKVLYRSDNKAPLAVVSKRFQVVQPGEILEFYKDLTEVGGFELETAGVLREGRKFWALARTGQSVSLKGRDRVDGYLLLATACDGTLATTAQFTSVRVVCNNTLAISLGNNSGAIKVPHRSQFDPDMVKRQLGITVSSWDGFVARMKALVGRPVDPDSVEGLLRRVLTYPAQGGQANVVNEQAVKAVRSLYDGGGKGATYASSRGTAWGLLNSVTEYVDHHRRARSDDHRRDAARGYCCWLHFWRLQVQRLIYRPRTGAVAHNVAVVLTV